MTPVVNKYIKLNLFFPHFVESCNSDDLVTVLEMHNRKPYKIIDRKREVKKGVMAESLDELICRGNSCCLLPA